MIRGMSTLNHIRVETDGDPVAMAERGDVLASHLKRGHALLRAGKLPAQDSGGIAHDLRVGLDCRPSTLNGKLEMLLTYQEPSRSGQRHGQGRR